MVKNRGLKEEEKVKNFFLSNLNKDNYSYKDSKGQGPIIENKFDFKVINKKSRNTHYFELYSPIRDQEIIDINMKEKGSATILLTYLEYGIISKYFKQFKNNINKFLIININDCESYIAFKSWHPTPIEKVFSVRCYPEGQYIGLFHQKIYKYSIGDIKTIKKNIKTININYLKNMQGVIIFLNDKFRQLIVNPYSKIYDVDEIIELFKITDKERPLINNMNLDTGVRIYNDQKVYNKLNNL